ncbi:MAG: LysR family transcriptional regulator [Acetobacteraceae bacterium]
MELRHLRYFIAVAEEGSLSLAAERRLHTAQPSLSRQIRDLEREVGVPLLTRSARGIALTAAGHAFLDHARLALSQVAAAGVAARRAAHPAKPSLALGFLTGHEMTWLPETLGILRDELPNIEVTVSSQYTPALTADLLSGRLDAAFLRPPLPTPGLAMKLLAREALVVVLPSDHRLAQRAAIRPQDFVTDPFISVSGTAPALRIVIDDYLKQCGIDLTPVHEVDNIAMAVSLVSSMRGVALLPAYVQHLLPGTVISRPVEGDAPTIDLVLGYHVANASPVLKLLLSRVDDLIGRVSGKTQ